MKKSRETKTQEMSEPQELQVLLLSPNARAPTRGSVGAAGYDLYAAEKTIVVKNSTVPVPTDIAVAIPDGYYGRVAPRSGLALKGITVRAGVVDQDYRGPINVLLSFTSSGKEKLGMWIMPTFYLVKKGDRIAQLILEKIATPPVRIVPELPPTERGSGGFGSTGK